MLLPPHLFPWSLYPRLSEVRVLLSWSKPLIFWKMLCVCCSDSSIEKRHGKKSKLVQDASSQDIYVFCRNVICGSGQLLSHAFDMYDGMVRWLSKASRTDNPWFCDIEAIKKKPVVTNHQFINNCIRYEFKSTINFKLSSLIVSQAAPALTYWHKLGLYWSLSAVPTI